MAGAGVGRDAIGSERPSPPLLLAEGRRASPPRLPRHRPDPRHRPPMPPPDVSRPLPQIPTPLPSVSIPSLLPYFSPFFLLTTRSAVTVTVPPPPLISPNGTQLRCPAVLKKRPETPCSFPSRCSFPPLFPPSPVQQPYLCPAPSAAYRTAITTLLALAVMRQQLIPMCFPGHAAVARVAIRAVLGILMECKQLVTRAGG